MFDPFTLKKVFAVKIDTIDILIFLVFKVLQPCFQFGRNFLVGIEANNPGCFYRKVFQGKVPLFGVILECIKKKSGTELLRYFNRMIGTA